jgi:hypothetical protein
MSAFVIKSIALTAMLLDHGQVVFPDVLPLWFRVIGRLAFPLFAYFVAEGFRHTRSPERFLLRLFIFAIISEPFFDYALMGSAGILNTDFLNRTNIFYTLFLGGAAITAYKYIIKTIPPHAFDPLVIKLIACAPVPFCLWLGEFLTADYGWAGVALIFTMYVIKRTQLRLFVMAVLCLSFYSSLYSLMLAGYSAYISIEHYLMVPAALLPIPLLTLYNAKRGPRSKWFFYVFYPAHLAILGGLAAALGTTP